MWDFIEFTDKDGLRYSVRISDIKAICTDIEDNEEITCVHVIILNQLRNIKIRESYDKIIKRMIMIYRNTLPKIYLKEDKICHTVIPV